MLRTTVDRRKTDFPGKSISTKNKNTFDLINELPKAFYKKDDSDTLEYAFLLMRAVKTLFPQQYKDLDFSEKYDNLYSFIIELETIVLNDNINALLKNTIYIDKDNPNQITIGIPDCEVGYLFIVYLSKIHEIKNKNLKIAYANFCYAFSSLSNGNPLQGSYDWSNYFENFNMDYDSFSVVGDEEVLEEDDNEYNFYQEKKHFLEFNKDYIHNHNYVKKLLKLPYDLESYKPRSKQNKIIKETLIEFFLAFNDFSIRDYLFSISAADEGCPYFESCFMLLPQDDENALEESESRDREFQQNGTAGFLDSALIVTPKKINIKQKKESTERFTRLMNAIEDVINKC